MVETGLTVAIVLFVVGGLLIVVAVFWLCCFVLRRKRRDQEEAQRRREAIMVYRRGKLSQTSGGSALQQTGSRLDGSTIQQVQPSAYTTNTLGSSRKTHSKNDEKASTIPSTSGPRIRGTFPMVKSERKGSKKSRVSSKSSDKVDGGTGRPRFMRGRRSVNQPGKNSTLHMIAPLATKYATYDGHGRHKSGSTPNLYDLRYIEPTEELKLSKKKRRRKPQIFVMDEMPRDRRVQSWLHRQHAGELSNVHPSLADHTREMSSPPSRASSVPLETSSMSTLDSAAAQALCLRWSPSMKRRSFDSETTAHTGTTLQKASDSFTTDTRSFIITPKTMMMTSTNYVQTSKVPESRLNDTKQADPRHEEPLYTLC